MQNEGAAAYVDFFDPVTAAITETLLDAAGVRQGVRLLDVACGPGTVAAGGASRGASTIGVDLSTGMLAQARRRHPHIEFTDGDAEALPFPDASFDAVTCSFGLAHFPDPDAAVREMARVLKSDGRVAVSWWSLPDGSKLNGNFFDTLGELKISPPPELPIGPPVTKYANPETLHALLVGAGLSDIAVLEEVWTVDMPDTETWWRGGMESIVRAAVIVRAQPPEMQTRVRETFDHLAERFRRGDRFVVPMAAKIASGRK